MKKKMVAGRVTGLGANALLFGFLVLICWVGAASAECTLFTENFESYTAGSNLLGQGDGLRAIQEGLSSKSLTEPICQPRSWTAVPPPSCAKKV